MENFVRQVVRASTRPKFKQTDRPVRCSSPPICEIATAFKLVRSGGADVESFVRDFYTSVGTVSHQIFQKWAARLGFLYGHWRCRWCQQTATGRGPQICPKCHVEMEYVEPKVKVDAGLEGHTDGLVYQGSGKYIVFDLKFVGDTTLARAKKQGKIDVHYCQVNLYAYGLTKHYKVNVVGTAVVYIHRANPHRFYVSYHEGIDVNVVKLCKRVLRKVNFIVNRRPQKLLELKPLCTNEEDADYCPYASVCFGPSGPYPYLRTLLEGA